MVPWDARDEMLIALAGRSRQERVSHPSAEPLELISHLAEAGSRFKGCSSQVQELVFVLLP